MAEIDPGVFERARNGDREAFWTLILPYRGLVYSVAYAMLKDQEQAEDLLHDALVNAFRALPNLRAPEKLPGWLYSMARNRAYEWLRKEQRTRRALMNSPRDWAAQKPPAGETSESEAMLESMEQALFRLPEPFRVLLAMKYTNRYSCREIAGILDISVPAVKSRLFEARKLLRKLTEAMALGEEGIGHGLS